jgi:predicted RecB family endonuclease
MTTHTTHLTRELDRRTNDGIDVRLLWCEHDDRVLVAVRDAKTGEAFAVEVKAGESALDVFRHPYAYAAFHRVDTRGGDHASAALDDAVAA